MVLQLKKKRKITCLFPCLRKGYMLIKKEDKKKIDHYVVTKERVAPISQEPTCCRQWSSSWKKRKISCLYPCRGKGFVLIKKKEKIRPLCCKKRACNFHMSPCQSVTTNRAIMTKMFFAHFPLKISSINKIGRTWPYWAAFIHSSQKYPKNIT